MSSGAADSLRAPAAYAFPMFTMHQHHPYAYAAAPPAPRQYSSHGTSSAFSSSANPDEDWTKISDLAERRRIQNRIAQRNYRKKLKRRLEDLEKRAGTLDGAAEKGQTGKSGKKSPTSAKAPKTTSSPSAQQSQSQQSQTPSPHQVPAMAAPPPAKVVVPSQFTPPMQPEDEYLFYDDGRQRSRSPPPMFAAAAYSAYPPPPHEDMLLAPYGSAPYRPMAATTAPEQQFAEYLTTPVTLPPLNHFSDAIKREPGFPGDEAMSPYSMGAYGYMPGMDLNAGGPYDHSNPHTPDLSHSFDHSATCSDAGYEYPTTPLSMPGSPGVITH